MIQLAVPATTLDVTSYGHVNLITLVAHQSGIGLIPVISNAHRQVGEFEALSEIDLWNAHDYRDVIPSRELTQPIAGFEMS